MYILKTILHIWFLFFSLNFIAAQNPPSPPTIPPQEEDVFKITTIWKDLAYFGKCSSENKEKCLAINLWKYLYVDHPISITKAAENAKIRKTAVVKFIVYVDGTIGNIELLQPVGYGVDENIIAAFKKMQKEVIWVPTKLHRKRNGEHLPVNMALQVPIQIWGDPDMRTGFNEVIYPILIKACETKPDFWTDHLEFSELLNRANYYDELENGQERSTTRFYENLHKERLDIPIADSIIKKYLH